MADKPVVQPPGVDVAAAARRRRLAQLPHTLVLTGIVIGLAAVAFGNDFRIGAALIAAAALAGAVLRLLLPEAQVGPLAVRRRVLDVLLLGGLGAVLAIITFVVPPPK